MRNKTKNRFYFTQYGALIVRIALVFLFYTISRALFFVFNQHFFIIPDGIGKAAYIFQVFLGGMRFDFSALLYINALCIFSAIIPFTIRSNRIYQKITTIIFYYVANIIAFAFDYIDIIYFRFTEKRMTSDIFRFAQTEGGFLNLIPGFFRDYWYIFLIFIVMMTAFVWLASRIRIRTKRSQPFSFVWFLKNLFYASLITGIFILGIRGGTQGRPISLDTAGQYAKTGNDAFVLNTPFSIISTIKSDALLPVHYFDEETLTSIYTPIRCYKTEDSIFLDKNVVIIILEGFSAEHSKYFNPKLEKSYTPHLDEIARKGSALLSYSNGMRSMEAIPAIISGIPTLMHNEYLTSSYAGNSISSLPAVLKTKGYSSAFFHGGDNGTLKFDSYADLAGFDHYYGAHEYGNKQDHDGAWGIFDGPFLQYALRQMDTLSRPFFSALFTLSSHHPYAVPDDYKKTLDDPQQEIGIRESILYADDALGKFMQEAEKYSWFKNTLFIFTADHASQSFEPYSRLRRYEIPLIFYAPYDSLPEFQAPFSQQIDIMPSVLHLLNYPERFFSFGNSAFAKHKAFAINYSQETYQFITEQNVLVFNGDSVIIFHDRNIQPANNLLGKKEVPGEDYDLMRAVIQTYNTALIENRLTLRRYENR